MAPAKKSHSKTSKVTKKSPPGGSTKTQRAQVAAAPAPPIDYFHNEMEEEVEDAAILSDTAGKGAHLKDDAAYKSKDDEEIGLSNDKSQHKLIHKRSPGKKKKASQETLDPTAKKWMERARRAERQLKVISKAQIINEFQDGEVRQYAKQVLWKKVKFITSDQTMVRCMKEAAAAFEIKADDLQDWMSTYSHSVREAINAQRNHCCQELRKTVLSKYKLSKKALYYPIATI
jgi:hypothetical protein